MNSWPTTRLEAWARSWRWKPRPRRPKKRRPHGPGWISPKAIEAGIANELVPAALALGWVSEEHRPARRRERRFGEFEFIRVSRNRIESMGFDFQYGGKPDVWLCLALWEGDGGVCIRFHTGSCWDYSERAEPFWLRVLMSFRHESLPQDPLAEALAKGLRRLEIAEAYFREGADHPDLGLTQTLPPYQWPEGYAERMN